VIRTAVLGATGMVGQIFVEMLKDHPWFDVSAVAASERCVGMKYGEVARWRLPGSMPSDVAELEVVEPTPKGVGDVDLVFSALPAEVAGRLEADFAKDGRIVVSDASSHRMDPDVPILIAEVNGPHVCLIDEQRRKKRWNGGIVTNPNCSTTALAMPLKPILEEHGVERVIVSTMQAVSGAGYPGVASLDILDNVIPFIPREEEKMEAETLKILGSPSKPARFKVSASCHRVATMDGHLEAVFVECGRETEPESIANTLERFSAEPQRLKLPTAPLKPIVVRSEEDRPQPRLDRMEGKGMSIVVGRIREDRALGGVKFVVLGHNTIRGAAGLAILNAEYLKVKKYI
jgi:aspartate-semialdehyde dehydrogenase